MPFSRATASGWRATPARAVRPCWTTASPRARSWRTRWIRTRPRPATRYSCSTSSTSHRRAWSNTGGWPRTIGKICRPSWTGPAGPRRSLRCTAERRFRASGNSGWPADQQLAQGPARGEVGQRFGGLGQRAARRHHRFQVQVAVHDLIHQVRDVALRHDRAVVAAEYPLIGFGEGERVEPRLASGRRQPDDNGAAAEAEGGDRLLGGVDLANGVEDVVKAL